MKRNGEREMKNINNRKYRKAKEESEGNENIERKRKYHRKQRK